MFLFNVNITVSGQGCDGTTFCIPGPNICKCNSLAGSPLGGCCEGDFDCLAGLVCDKSNNLVAGKNLIVASL